MSYVVTSYTQIQGSTRAGRSSTRCTRLDRAVTRAIELSASDDRPTVTVSSSGPHGRTLLGSARDGSFTPTDKYQSHDPANSEQGDTMTTTATKARTRSKRRDVTAAAKDAVAAKLTSAPPATDPVPLPTILRMSDTQITAAFGRAETGLSELPSELAGLRFAQAYRRFLAGSIKSPPSAATHKITKQDARGLRDAVRRFYAGGEPAVPGEVAAAQEAAHERADASADDAEIMRDALRALVRERATAHADARAALEQARDLAKRLGA